MIELSDKQVAAADIYSSNASVTHDATPENPVWHKVYLRVKFEDNDQADSSRTMRVKVTSGSGVNTYLNATLFLKTTGDAEEPAFFTLGPMIVGGGEALVFKIEESDNSEDIDIDMRAWLLSDDLDYTLSFVAAQATPTANSLTERVKAIDDKLPSSSYLLGSSSSSGQINAAAFAADAIAAAGIATGAFTADAFAADALVAATFATGAFTADAFAADAIVAATFATNSITADALAADAVTEIQLGLGTSANQTTILTNIAAIKAETVLIVADTNELQLAQGDWATATSVTVSDKTGFSLAATGANLILKNSTFALALSDAVWDEALSGHAVAGTSGAALSAAGAAGDLWSTALPGAYTAGMAGYIVGTNLDEPVSEVGGAGAGAVTDSLRIREDDESTVIDGAEVWITNDVAGVDGGTVIEGTLYTNSNGIVEFNLDTGDYWVHVQKGGQNFGTTYPRKMTVSAGGFAWS